MPAVIAVSGLPGAGKTTTINLLEIVLRNQGFPVSVFRAGPTFRAQHTEYVGQGGTKPFREWYAETSVEANRAVDERVVAFARQNNCILDARYSAAACQRAGVPYFGIFLEASLSTRAARNIKMDEKKSLADVQAELEARQADEVRICTALHGLSHLKASLYHMPLINNEFLSPEEVVAEIVGNTQFMDCVKSNYARRVA